MTVKELKEILSDVSENLEVKLLPCCDDNINDNYSIDDVVMVKPCTSSNRYKEELVLIPE